MWRCAEPREEGSFANARHMIRQERPAEVDPQLSKILRSA